jgi:hypothetical protein
MGTGSFRGVEIGRGVTLTPHPLLVPKSKNRVELYLSSKPNDNKNIITVVSGAVCVIMNIVIIKVRRGSGVHNVRYHKLPRGPSLKE